MKVGLRKNKVFHAIMSQSGRIIWESIMELSCASNQRKMWGNVIRAEHKAGIFPHISLPGSSKPFHTRPAYLLRLQRGFIFKKGRIDSSFIMLFFLFEIVELWQSRRLVPSKPISGAKPDLAVPLKAHFLCFSIWEIQFACRKKVNVSDGQKV